jgi:broad specificity phosphatase PhoE
LICLRHCESENVIVGAAGALPDAGLTERGRREARALMTKIHEYGPVAAWYASDALRARQTAEALAGDASVTLLPDLAEIHIGRLEGSLDAAVSRRTAEVLRSWVVDNDWSAAVADGESGYAVRARMMRAFTAIAARRPGQTVIVVGHVGSLTAALVALCPDLRVWGAPLPHGVPFPVTFDGTWRCEWPAPAAV